MARAGPGYIRPGGGIEPRMAHALRSSLLRLLQVYTEMKNRTAVPGTHLEAHGCASHTYISK